MRRKSSKQTFQERTGPHEECTNVIHCIENINSLKFVLEFKTRHSYLPDSNSISNYSGKVTK